MDIAKILDIPRLWASLVDWYFDPTKAEWEAHFKDEDQERQIIFAITELMRLIQSYIGADLKAEVMDRGKDESTTGNQSA